MLIIPFLILITYETRDVKFCMMMHNEIDHIHFVPKNNVFFLLTVTNSEGAMLRIYA
jgi:hypothetical protein